MEDIEAKKKRLREIEEMLEREEKAQKIRRAEFDRDFRKARTHILATLGAEYLKYRKIKITPDNLELTKLVKQEMVVFNALMDSIPKCPNCKKPLIRWQDNEKGVYWFCASGCQKHYADANGVPNFAQEFTRE